MDLLWFPVLGVIGFSGRAFFCQGFQSLFNQPTLRLTCCLSKTTQASLGSLYPKVQLLTRLLSLGTPGSYRLPIREL